MKTVKKFWRYACFFFAMLLIGCTSDVEELVPETTETFQYSRESDPIILIENGEIVRMVITYVQGTSDLTKQSIRAAHFATNYLVLVDRTFDFNVDVELWYVRSNCPPEITCRPKVYHPNDPDIESSVVLERT